MTDETKSEAFKRIAGPRVQNILDRLDILANTADKSRYEYTDEQIEKIKQALDDKIGSVFDKFTNGKTENKTFEL